MMPGEQARDAGLTLKEETKTQMLECIDHFHTELQMQSKKLQPCLNQYKQRVYCVQH